MYVGVVGVGLVLVPACSELGEPIGWRTRHKKSRVKGQGKASLLVALLVFGACDMRGDVVTWS
jgi:hypothetical protein